MAIFSHLLLLGTQFVMGLTHSYRDTKLNGAKCLFFLLFEDYIEAQTQFARELDLELERFARNLKGSGLLMRPFSGDIETVRSQVSVKNWPDDQRKELEKTPALLMINVDFEEFDPQSHPWFLLNFGERMSEGTPGAYRFRETLKNLTEIVSTSNVDIFEGRESNTKCIFQRQLKYSKQSQVYSALVSI